MSDPHSNFACRREKDEYRKLTLIPQPYGRGATSWVFNWRADGWGRGEFESDPHDFRGGVTGRCVLTSCTDPPKGHSHVMACKVNFAGHDNFAGQVDAPATLDAPATCRVHVTFAILDKDDQTLRELPEFGSEKAPAELGAIAMAPRAGTGKKEEGTGKIGEVFPHGGRAFTPTAEEKALSVRPLPLSF